MNEANPTLSVNSPCKEYLKKRRDEIEKTLWELVPNAEGISAKLNEAMRYPLESGGKRLRPILVLAGSELCRGVSSADLYTGRYWDGVDDEFRQALLTVACSIEMIHTYSLVHDDLPCMDDDDLRRGRPTAHIVYGEAMAVLSADALHSFAFQLVSSVPDKYAVQAFRVVRELAVACGYPGMVAGQVVDLEYESKPGTEEVLEYIHEHKTAALLRASLLMGAQMVDASEADCQLLHEVGSKIGLIFQVVDDILDVVGDTAVLGKQVGSDEGHDKLTYPALIGLDESRKRVDSLFGEVETALETIGDRGTLLLDITKELVNRNT